MAASKQTHVQVTLDVVFGSKFQRDFGMRTLDGVLAAWTDELERRHSQKQNLDHEAASTP